MNNENIMTNYLLNPKQIKLARPMLVSLMLGLSISSIQNTAIAGDNNIVGPSMIQYDTTKPVEGLSKKEQRGIPANQLDTSNVKLAPRTKPVKNAYPPYGYNPGLKETTPTLTNKKSTSSTKSGNPNAIKKSGYSPRTPLTTTTTKKPPLKQKTATQKKTSQTVPRSTGLQPYKPAPSTGFYNGQKQFNSGAISKPSRPNTLQPKIVPQNTTRPTGLVRSSSAISCPDPAVVRVVAGWPSRNADGTYNFRLFAVVRNIGQETYNSQRNQQHIVLKQGNSVLKTSTWSGSVVPPGARGEVASEFYDVRNWNSNPGEFAADFSAQIIYAPDIRVDGNPLNDDCRNSNNRKVLTVAELRRILGELR